MPITPPLEAVIRTAVEEAVQKVVAVIDTREAAVVASLEQALAQVRNGNKAPTAKKRRGRKAAAKTNNASPAKAKVANPGRAEGLVLQRHAIGRRRFSRKSGSKSRARIHLFSSLGETSISSRNSSSERPRKNIP